MLKRICDRCAAEMPMEQAMGADELILRRINGNPYDLCPACQKELKEWFDNHGAMINSVTIDSDGTAQAQMIPKGFKVLEFVTLCRDCRFYDPRGQRCASLSFTVAPDFWCKHGKKTDFEVKDAGTDMVGSARDAGKRYAGFNEERCDCYHDENGQPCCWGTREKDPCDCEGDERRCTHYPEKRG